MQLLDPGKIKDEKKQTEILTQKRILALQTEEAEANRRTNAALEVERNEKKRIANELGIGLPELEVKKTLLESYVPALEAQRAEAMQPVEKLRQEAQVQLDENLKQGKILAGKISNIEQEKEKLLERIDQQTDREIVFKEKQGEVDRREKTVKAQEAELTRSTNSLSDKWLTYYTTVAKNNEELFKKTSAVEVESEANKVRAAELEKIALDQIEHGRQIKDKYATLESAIKEWRDKGVAI